MTDGPGCIAARGISAWVQSAFDSRKLLQLERQLGTTASKYCEKPLYRQSLGIVSESTLTLASGRNSVPYSRTVEIIEGIRTGWHALGQGAAVIPLDNGGSSDRYGPGKGPGAVLRGEGLEVG